MLALRDGTADGLVPPAGGLGVEVDSVARVVERGVKVGGPLFYAVGRGELVQLGGVAADEGGLGDDDLAVGGLDAALGADGADGTDEVLVCAHVAGHAIHDDPDAVGFDACHVG